MAAATSLALAAAGVGAGASIYSGIEGRKAANEQADMARAQASDEAAEVRRLAARQAELEGRNIDSTIASQKVAYLASGVTLEGSPLLMLEKTRREGAENLEEIRKAGESGSRSSLAQGQAIAESAKSAGRQQLVSGISGAVKSASAGYSVYKGLK
jgi:hypothetical protein